MIASLNDCIVSVSNFIDSIVFDFIVHGLMDVSHKWIVFGDYENARSINLYNK